MTPNEQQLLDILSIRSVKCGSFRLASGEESNYYIDGKMTEVFSSGAYLIGEVIYEHTVNLNIDAIGGLEAGAIPLATAAVISYHSHGKKMEGFWVREKTKDHGTQQLVEGGLRKGMRLVIVDDVFTKGNSAMKAVQEVRKLDCEVVLVLGIVDRLRGAGELFRGDGLNYKAVFTIRDFGIEPSSSGKANPASQ